ncbi:ABC transporter permease [Paenibacillus sp. Marseille-Q4541]|uniref:ABC transporter permease n=1 Tax=Paenibacillus sp. Marseille-Q4541 TaxID=2831522 RepID=UPI001BA9DE48|nr:ABC transporter permease [Paenibacillus sp. Marseille-Q4541]
MHLYKKIALTVIAIISTCLFFGILQVYDQSNLKLIVHFQVKSDVSGEYQLFYSNDADKPEWKEDNSFKENYEVVDGWKSIEFHIPNDTMAIRLDTGDKKANIQIKRLALKSNKEVFITESSSFVSFNDLKIKSQGNEVNEYVADNGDPYLIVNIGSYITASMDGINIITLLFYIILSLLLGGITTYSARYSKETIFYIREVFKNRKWILNLARNDFKTKYASSYLGVIWGFIHPLLTIATYWFVFQVGLRSGDVAEVPFILWFIAGIIPWFFFSDAFSGATNVLSEYSYLVKKVVFKIELLPSVKIVSALFVQLFFIGFIFVVYSFYGYYPDLYNLQLFYYIVCLVFLLFSLTILTSAVVLFFKDLNQIIAIILQMGFWFTPIGWSTSMLSDFWAFIFKLNPMYYIVQGYRDSFIDKVLFYEHPYQTLYFWVLCLFILTAGIVIFKKLKPHFSDVL